jgi:hypothetical protein
MALPGSDEPSSISHEEARQELFGHGPSRAGLAAYEIIVLILGMVGSAIAFDQIDNWSQWGGAGRDHRHGDRFHDRRQPQPAGRLALL